MAVSEFTRRELIERMKVPPERIELIVKGVDSDRFVPGPKLPAFVERYDLAGMQVLLTIGRLVERKGIDTTIRALPKILARCAEARYLVVGTGEYLPRL